MTGLEKIIAEIRDEAAAEAAALLSEANTKASAIIDAAKAESVAKATEALATAEHEVAAIKRSGEAAAALKRRQLGLAKKQEQIALTINAALEALGNLSADEYFDRIIAMAAKEAQQGSGKVFLSSADMKRLPEGFAEKLAAALPAGCALTVEEGSAVTGGGLVLSYNEIEINCTFGAIFNARHNELEDIAREALFA